MGPRQQVRPGQTRERRQRLQVAASPFSVAPRPGSRPSDRPLAASRRHALQPPNAAPGRGAAARLGPPRRRLRRAGTHGRKLRESRLRHGLRGPHASRVLRPLVRPLSCGIGGPEDRRGAGGRLGLRSAGALHSPGGPGCGRLLARRWQPRGAPPGVGVGAGADPGRRKPRFPLRATSLPPCACCTSYGEDLPIPSPSDRYLSVSR